MDMYSLGDPLVMAMDGLGNFEFMGTDDIGDPQVTVETFLKLILEAHKNFFSKVPSVENKKWECHILDLALSVLIIIINCTSFPDSIPFLPHSFQKLLQVE